MICIIGTRCSGKTQKLIELSASTKTPILTKDEPSKRQLLEHARNIGRSILECRKEGKR